MEILASIFVAIITFANTLVPQANLPQVLGVQIASTDSVNTEPLKTATTSARYELKQQKIELLEQAKQKRLEIEQQTKQKRLELIAEMAAKREEFKTKLQTIKDVNKQKLVENIDQRISFLNTNWVNLWNAALTRLTEILAKIESRSNELAATGKDTRDLNNAIAVAKTAINNAQNLVTDQSGKSYVINITNETSLHEDVKSQMSKFKTDSLEIRKSIQAAREAVHKAFQALVALRPNKDKESDIASPSATPSI
jgi:hypothetical protein